MKRKYANRHYITPTIASRARVPLHELVNRDRELYDNLPDDQIHCQCGEIAPYEYGRIIHCPHCGKNPIPF